MPPEYKMFNDSVHGHIKLHPVCVQIIDTLEFQRLRNIKQCGPLYWVFPGSSHNRFEHSLGVCYLAGQMVEALRRNCSYDIISDDEKLCLEIAGLCHDLGHGPMSHTWEKFLKAASRSNGTGNNGGWRHEDASIKMFRHLMFNNSNKLKNLLEKALPDMIEKGIDFMKLIEELIMGKGKTLGNEKIFLYEIISNKETGIDVDRWDYFLRDGLHLNFKFTFDYRRLLEFCRVINVEGKKRICFRNKEAQNIYDMFLVRAKLHNRAYGHHVSRSIEEMFIDAFVAADKEGYEVCVPSGTKFKLSEAHKNMESLTCLTDHIIFDILCSAKCGKARALMQRILNRDLYTVVYCKNFSARLAKALREKESYTDTQKLKADVEEEIRIYKQEIQEEIKKLCRSMEYYTEDKFKVEIVKLDMGIEFSNATRNAGSKINPFSNIHFYDKKDVDKAVVMEWEHVPIFLIPEDSIHRIEALIIYKNHESLKNHTQALQELKEIRDELAQRWKSQ
ncbi:deoxynucleoside triphosphate triphosphohydrolase SAMHD1 isoform X2 [Periplaneta americana]